MTRTLIRQLTSVAALLLACSACSSGSSSSSHSTGSSAPAGTGSSTASGVATTTGCVVDKITTAIPTAGVDTAFGVTQGPGGTWYAHGGTINRISGGKLDQFPIPDGTTASAGWLTWDGTSPSLWFSDRANGRIGTIDGAGKVTEFKVADGPNGADGPGAIIVGPGTKVWFTEPINSRIGVLDTTTGKVTLRPAPTADGGPLGMVRGLDGNLWFTEREGDKVARMNSNGSFTEWKLASGSSPNRIVVGPDKAVWFTELKGNKIGRIDAAGHLTELALAGGPVGITVGPDAHMYVALWNAKQLARLHDDGSLDRTWDLPHGALQVAAGVKTMWATNAFDDSVTSVQLSC